ncbi:MAG: DUF5723 family protein [Bacteroidia bacterium]|nr:DUF5723 family protein [Bacteroidia bacterium]
MKKIFLLILSALFFVLVGFPTAKAQMYLENGRQVCCGDSILNGSYLSLGINPAHLGRVLSVKRGSGFLQIGGSFYSHGLDLGQVLDLSLTDGLVDENVKQEIVDRYPPSDNFEYDGKLEINWLSFSYAHPKYGGFAIQVQDRFVSTATIPNDFLGVLLLGGQAPVFQQPNGSSIAPSTANGTSIDYGHYRSIRLGYGVKLLDLDQVKLYGGITYSRLFGIGRLDASIEDQEFVSVSSFSELYQLDYQNINIQDPNYQRQILSNAGTGNAFSLGVSLDIGKDANISASIIDIGSLKFTKNVSRHTASSTSIIDSIGQGVVNSYNAGEISIDLFNLTDRNSINEINVNLNTHARVGGTYRIDEKFIANAEAIIPMRSQDLSVIDVESATVIGTVTWNPIPKVFYLTAGTFYNPQVGWRIPVGASFGLGPRARISISTGDLATFLGAPDPMASLSISLLGHNY